MQHNRMILKVFGNRKFQMLLLEHLTNYLQMQQNDDKSYHVTISLSSVDCNIFILVLLQKLMLQILPQMMVYLTPSWLTVWPSIRKTVWSLKILGVCVVHACSGFHRMWSYGANIWKNRWLEHCSAILLKELEKMALSKSNWIRSFLG